MEAAASSPSLRVSRAASATSARAIAPGCKTTTGSGDCPRLRSQNARLSWERFLKFVDRFFPPIKVLHPLPCHRFERHNPREEPGALAAPAGICAGGEE